MDREELRRLATEATGIQSHVILKTPDLVDLLDALERAEADVSRMADENANLRNRCAMLSFEEAEALLMLEKAERERDALRHHYDKAGPEHNLLALLDMYDERRAAAESERDEARAEREARPDISAEDAAALVADYERVTDPVSPAEERALSALRAHAAKVKP